MKVIQRDILTRSPDADKGILVVNPVSWLPGIKTPFNERLEALFPDIPQDCQTAQATLGSDVRGKACFTSCLDTHGLVIASVFCIDQNGLSVIDLRNGLTYLTQQRPERHYRLPDNMGFNQLTATRSAYIGLLMPQILWANNIEAQLWKWKIYVPKETP